MMCLIWRVAGVKKEKGRYSAGNCTSVDADPRYIDGCVCSSLCLECIVPFLEVTVFLEQFCRNLPTKSSANKPSVLEATQSACLQKLMTSTRILSSTSKLRRRFRQATKEGRLVNGRLERYVCCHMSKHYVFS